MRRSEARSGRRADRPVRRRVRGGSGGAALPGSPATVPVRVVGLYLRAGRPFRTTPTGGVRLPRRFLAWQDASNCLVSHNI
jgi:hypothetical protein